MDAPHLKTGNKSRTYTPPHFNFVVMVLNGSIRQEKSTKIGKEQVKLSLFAENMFFFNMEDLRSTKEQLLELFNKVTGHRAIHRGRKNMCVYVCVCVYSFADSFPL